MCNYCSGTKTKINQYEILNHDTIQLKEGNLIVEGTVPCSYDNIDFAIKIQINYCPKCGRKLQED